MFGGTFWYHYGVDVLTRQFFQAKRETEADLGSDRMMQIVRKEMNRRRRYGGAEDVPTLLWGNAEVDQALTQAAECAEEEGFDGDWDTAPMGLEESVDALAGLLRRLSAQRPFVEGHQEQITTQRHDRQVKEAGQIPVIIRRDVGSQTLSDYLSWVLQGDEVAGEVRRRVCGDQILTRREAWIFLTSPLAKVMRFEDYEGLGLCPVRTTGRILSKDGEKDKAASKGGGEFLRLSSWEGGVHSYRIEVHLPGRNKKTTVRRLELERNDINFLYVSHRNLLGQAHLQHTGVEISGDPPLVAPYFDDSERFVEGYWESPVGHLLDFANCMCHFYRVTIWDMLEALMTGNFPPQTTVTATAWDLDMSGVGNIYPGGTFCAQGSVSLTVQPWVTPEALADAWREHRKTNPCYSPSEKQAEALRFVLAHTPPGEEFAWESLARQWQEERGELMTRGQLLKQFQRARAAILPGYRDLGGE